MSRVTSPLNLAIISDQLAGGIGGAESILFLAHHLFPHAPIYSTVVNHDIIPDAYTHLNIRTSFIQNLPFAKTHYKAYLPIMPLAVEMLNLQEFDVIFSSHHSVIKGVIPRPDATHICYCHSPARYLWDLFWTYSDLNGFNPLTRLGIGLVSQYLRMWDVTAAQRVDHFLANSTYTAQRIESFYRRRAEILYPPVDTQKFAPPTLSTHPSEDYYVMVGRLVAYKGFELAIDAFNASGKTLYILGSGPELNKLRAKAKSNVHVMGRVSEEVLIEKMTHCRGFVFPGKEDFGIVMAEAQSAGKPVIGLNAGGAKDIVIHGETGILFNESTVEAVNKAVEQVEATRWNHAAITEHSHQFDQSRFNQRLKSILENATEYKSVRRAPVRQSDWSMAFPN